jgi:MFS family permease
MFIGTFAWSFVYVSLPFWVQRISPGDEASTLRWTGWVLGITPLVTIVTSPLWGRLSERGNPKHLYVAVEVVQGLGFLGMAVARTVVELFLARAALGFVGAASTFAFVMVGRRGGDLRRGVSDIQSAMTVGQVVGPLVGAIAAARVGFRPSFLLAGIILWICALVVGWGVPGRLGRASDEARPRRASVREVATVCLLVLAGSTQIFFLTAILPQVLPELGVAPEDTLEVGGLVLFASGIAAALGSVGAPWVAGAIGERRTVVWLLAASSALVALLAVAPEIWSFGTVRFVQVLCIAPVFPLAVARIAQRASGEAIGLVNSSRIGASFVGPVVATTLLAWGRPAIVYVLLAGAGLALFPLVRDRRRRRREGAGEGLS